MGRPLVSPPAGRHVNLLYRLPAQRMGAETAADLLRVTKETFLCFWLPIVHTHLLTCSETLRWRVVRAKGGKQGGREPGSKGCDLLGSGGDADSVGSLYYRSPQGAGSRPA